MKLQLILNEDMLNDISDMLGSSNSCPSNFDLPEYEDACRCCEDCWKDALLTIIDKEES